MWESRSILTCRPRSCHRAGPNVGCATTSSAASPEDVMSLTELLGLPVTVDGQTVGWLTDVRFELSGDTLADARLFGLLISRRRRGSFLGYERTGVDAPALVARFE